MVALIGAIVSAVAGIVGNVNNSATGQLLTYRAENESSIQYSRQKNLTFYNAYKNQLLVLGGIALIGFVFIMFIVYQSKK
jgi:hypothetical protein